LHFRVETVQKQSPSKNRKHTLDEKWRAGELELNVRLGKCESTQFVFDFGNSYKRLDRILFFIQSVYCCQDEPSIHH